MSLVLYRHRNLTYTLILRAKKLKVSLQKTHTLISDQSDVMELIIRDGLDISLN